MSDQNEWPKPGETPSGAANGQPDGAPAPDAPQAPSAPEAPGAPQHPFGQQQQDPYAAPQQPQNPYGAPHPQNPYAQPQYGHQQQHQPYAAPQQPYGQQQQNPYAQQQNSYGQQQNPYAQQQNPYAAPHNPYAQQQYTADPAAYQPYAQRPKTNTLAILSIVFGLAAIPMWFLAILLGPAGAILGHVALGKIKQNGEAGRGLALTGIISGWVMTGIWLIWVAFIIFLAAAGQDAYSTYDYDSSTGAFIG
ncbi:DUF4190 domain-containing protein [Curtobacterium oceanosedimentum]|uniref:DUF4190 domain-containing protein n=1 Tax=Curtobacterium oceanosedimentum TaxID=465820 RepID=UPI0027E13055|nr:DUF4190 domain-containing protein [Curtobacterium oceanosedimentum]